MDNYTVTFVYDGSFDLPDDPQEIDEKVPGMVLEKLEKHEFELADFNLTQNYDDEYAESYIETDPYRHRAVLELKLDLNIRDLNSREAIYHRCLDAVKHGELHLCRAYENDDKEQGILQSIICFEANVANGAQAMKKSG